MEIIQDKMDRKLSLIQSPLNVETNDDLNQVQDLNPATKSLLNKYRRESVNLPFKESFFDDNNTNKTSEPPPIIIINNIIPRKQSNSILIEQQTSPPPPPATIRKMSTSSSYVNYHFLNRFTKSKMSQSESSDTNTEDETNNSSSGGLSKHVEESIKKDIEIKTEIINNNDNNSELAKRQENLNPATVNLLNKYRRESVNLPYAESFFTDPIEKVDDEETKSKHFLSILKKRL